MRIMGIKDKWEAINRLVSQYDSLRNYYQYQEKCNNLMNEINEKYDDHKIDNKHIRPIISN